MNILVSILLVLAGLVALLLLLALFLKRQHYVKRAIVIDAPRQEVFDYVKLLRNQETFNDGAMADPARNKEFRGTDGTVGFVYAWSGNKDAGQGEKEIMDIEEGKRVEMEIRFVKPMRATARIVMETESLPGGQTRVSWSNAGTLPYPLNIMVPMVERGVGKGMDTSLARLKGILEKRPAAAALH